MSNFKSHLRDIHRTLAWLLVMFLGAWQSVYGRTEYLGDWIFYLNVSRAVSRFDWKVIFDPMWSPGYPALIALARVIAPHTPLGEWCAIAVLNWLIFVGAFGCRQYLISQFLAPYDPSLVGRANDPAILLGYDLSLFELYSLP